MGETVTVAAHDGSFLAHAAYCPQSQIRARAWSFEAGDRIDAAFLETRLASSIARRASLRPGSNAVRLVHGESDGLPGLVVDRYADVLVAQFLAAGVERWREEILDCLKEATGCEAIFERSDAEVRKLEGLEPRVGFARGNQNASRCPIIEHGLNFRVD